MSILRSQLGTLDMSDVTTGEALRPIQPGDGVVALEKADKVIESESTIVLTRRESLRLMEMLENPPPRNEKFLQAQSLYMRTKRAGFYRE
ncbi:MAG: DUF1778 domain-containing protein [Rhodoferax sp.]|nr:DUF1778 domain-containing protein [Rhodoferax sp.]